MDRAQGMAGVPSGEQVVLVLILAEGVEAVEDAHLLQLLDGQEQGALGHDQLAPMKLVGNEGAVELGLGLRLHEVAQVLHPLLDQQRCHLRGLIEGSLDGFQLASHAPEQQVHLVGQALGQLLVAEAGGDTGIGAHEEMGPAAGIAEDTLAALLVGGVSRPADIVQEARLRLELGHQGFGQLTQAHLDPGVGREAVLAFPRLLAEGLRRPRRLVGVREGSPVRGRCVREPPLGVRDQLVDARVLDPHLDQGLDALIQVRVDAVAVWIVDGEHPDRAVADLAALQVVVQQVDPGWGPVDGQMARPPGQHAVHQEPRLVFVPGPPVDHPLQSHDGVIAQLLQLGIGLPHRRRRVPRIRGRSRGRFPGRGRVVPGQPVAQRQVPQAQHHNHQHDPRYQVGRIPPCRRRGGGRGGAPSRRTAARLALAAHSLRSTRWISSPALTYRVSMVGLTAMRMRSLGLPNICSLRRNFPRLL